MGLFHAVEDGCCVAAPGKSVRTGSSTSIGAQCGYLLMNHCSNIFFQNWQNQPQMQRSKQLHVFFIERVWLVVVVCGIIEFIGEAIQTMLWLPNFEELDGG